MANIDIAAEIERIQAAKATLSDKGVALGISVEDDLIDELADKFDSELINRGAVSQSIMEGESVTIARGFHNGAGSISAIGNSGDYTLQAKTATPATSSQTVTPDSGYYGLSSVVVGAIPSSYKDTSAATAVASDILSGKIAITGSGQVVGTMVNNGSVTTSFDALTSSSVTIPSGYTSGGSVSITSSIENRLAAI